MLFLLDRSRQVAGMRLGRIPVVIKEELLLQQRSREDGLYSPFSDPALLPVTARKQLGDILQLFPDTCQASGYGSVFVPAQWR